jgi:hypothetical protein
VLEYVEDGTMLSATWNSHREDSERRSNLFSGLARIMLAVARVPLPRIGSWTIDDQGRLSLTGRPLIGVMESFENEGIPTIPRNTTYDNVDSYYLDVLAYHGNRLKYQPNSIQDEVDGESQLAFLTLMPALMRHYTQREQRHGPFAMQLTDLHPSNIFVDENWRVTKIIDLEWACALPLEMPILPFWLTGIALDGLFGKKVEPFKAAIEEFTQALEKESSCDMHVRVTQTVRATWKSGAFWFFSALFAPDCLQTLFSAHIDALFRSLADRLKEGPTLAAPFWTPKADEFIKQKLRDKEKYVERLKEIFEQEEGVDLAKLAKP